MDSEVFPSLVQSATLSAADLDGWYCLLTLIPVLKGSQVIVKHILRHIEMNLVGLFFK